MYCKAGTLLPLGRQEEALPLLEESKEVLATGKDVQSEIIVYGTLALAHLRLGNLDRAMGAAEEALARIDRTLPTVVHTQQGYGGAAEVFLELWAHARRMGDVEDGFSRRATRACRALRKLSFVIPMGRPLADVHAGHLAWLQGRKKESERLLRRAMRRGQELSMPYEEALASAHLGRFFGLEKERGDAIRLFERMGCAHHLEQLKSPQS